MRRRVLVLLIAMICLPVAARGEIERVGDYRPFDISAWTPDAAIQVGTTSVGVVSIDEGSSLESNTLTVGSVIGRGFVDIDGSGSIWSLRQDLQINSGTIELTSGGRIQTPRVTIGQAEETSGYLLVQGDSSLFEYQTELVVGGVGSGAVLIADGGKVVASDPSNTISVLATEWHSEGTVEVEGIGSEWIAGNLEIGKAALASGFMTVTSGGIVRSTSALVGFASRVEVSGNGSQWINNGPLILDDTAIQITDGGAVTTGVTSGDLSIAGITVSGDNSLLKIDGDLSFSNGSFTINDRGLVQVDGTLTFGEGGSSSGFILLDSGGRLAIAGDFADSLSQFIEGTGDPEVIFTYDPIFRMLSPMTEWTYGEDYTLEYFDAGGLAGYTVLTVGGELTLLPGDFNNDGTVDLADYTVWRNNLGEPDEAIINNAGDGLGGVDMGDYELWKSRLGDTAATSTNAAVPEPSSVFLAVLVLLVVAATVRAN